MPPPVTRSPTVLIAQPFSSPAPGPHAQPADHAVFVESNPLENLRDHEQVIDQSRAESLNENSQQPRANRPEQSASAARSQGAAAEAQSNEPGTEGNPASSFDVSVGGVLGPNGQQMDVSITVGRKGDDIYTFWLSQLFLFATWTTILCAIGEEVGPKGGHSHLQCIMSFLVLVPYEEALKQIVKAIKTFIPIERGSKGYVSCKVLQGHQSVLGMIGYVTKLPLRVKLWNISAAMLAEAQKYYSLVKVDPLNGRRPLNKSNFFKEVYAFWHRELRPLWHSMEDVLLFMIQSCQYMLTAAWISGTNGVGIDITRATKYWAMLHAPADVTLDHVMSIFFFTPRSGGRYFSAAPDITTVQNEVARQVARQRPTRTTLEEARATADAARPTDYEHHYCPAQATHIDPEVTIVDEVDGDEAAADEGAPETPTLVTVDHDVRRSRMPMRDTTFSTMDQLIGTMRNTNMGPAVTAGDLDGPGHHHNQLADLDEEEAEDDGLRRTRRRISSQWIEDQAAADASD